MGKSNENVVGVSIGKPLIDRLKRQAVRETAKYQKPVTVTEIVKAAVEEYLGYWETGIDTAVLDGEQPPAVDDSDCSPAGPV